MNSFAPIIIPTLNRYEHLKVCIDSLKRNKYAIETELYISIDCPTKESHIEGNNKIKEYLINGINGFKKVTYYVQKKNLGLVGNMMFLISEVLKKYDEYIFTEDDNVFAPSALEYFNRGLQLYKKNEEIIAISTKNQEELNVPLKDNVYLVNSFSAYGYATWKEKIEKVMLAINDDMITDLVKDKLFIHDLCKLDITYLRAFTGIILKKDNIYFDNNGNLAMIDFTISFYMQHKKKYVLYPRKVMSINNGYDGTGTNCKKMDNRNIVALNMEDEFSFVQSGKLEIEPIQNKDREYVFERFFLKTEVILFKYFGDRFLNFYSKVRSHRSR